MKLKLAICVAFLGALIFTVALSASPGDEENWGQWRGPDFNGVAAPGSYPVKFSATDDLLWRVSLPGKGSSTPVKEPLN